MNLARILRKNSKKTEEESATEMKIEVVENKNENKGNMFNPKVALKVIFGMKPETKATIAKTENTTKEKDNHPESDRILKYLTIIVMIVACVVATSAITLGLTGLSAVIIAHIDKDSRTADFLNKLAGAAKKKNNEK